MCLLAIAWHAHEDYALVVCANRDEFLARETLRAHFWTDHPHLFAGRDLQGGGSWMGISRRGRFAAVTNIRDPKANKPDARSRGLLVSQFLDCESSAMDYCCSLQNEAGLYNGYNFVAFDGQTLVYQSNVLEQPVSLSPGIHAISNGSIADSWPKTRSAAKKLRQWLSCSTDSIDDLARILNDRAIAPDDELPETGVSQDMERVLSAEFIDLPGYGTRCSTAFVVKKSGRAEYLEVSHDSNADESRQVLDRFLR